MEPSQLKSLYRKMLRIRRVEEAVGNEYDKKEMRCPVHLSIGQEAVPIGICEQLSHQDRIYSTHRCHAHYLAKDGSLNQMIAEMHGKVTGCCKGRGGSMHLVHPETGMMGSSAIVAGTIPTAVGNALSFSLEGKPFVSLAFFGDGASEEGIFYESLNFAALKQLPVIFVCENNQYATFSHQSARQATPFIHRRGESLGVPAERVDGNDVVAVYKSAQVAINRARTGKGPTLLEFTTYRYRDHVGPSSGLEVGYRTKEEMDGAMAHDPILKLQKQLLEDGTLTAEEIVLIETEIKNEIDVAFQEARLAPLPAASEMFADIYA